MSSNQQIIDVFQQLLELRESQNETYRARAYEKAIPNIRAYPEKITSGQQARTISGIGESLATKIDEILTTGTVPELAGTVDHSKKDVIDLFMSIERVGRKTAERWYESGYRTLSDIPKEATTEGQWLSIQLYPDLIQKIPRAEIQQFQEYLHHALPTLQFEIAGSYRRGKPESGDIDVLLLDQPGYNVMQSVIDLPVIKYTLASGPKKFLGIVLIDQLYRRIDLELVQPDEYPFALIYFTGPARFNVMMREHAAQMGYRLNEKSLTDPSGNKYPAETEQQVFEMLGLQYLTPEQRQEYA